MRRRIEPLVNFEDATHGVGAFQSRAQARNSSQFIAEIPKET